MTDCTRDDSTECDCPRCVSNDAAWERDQGWDDDGWGWGEACPSCGEPDMLGCDPACPAAGEQLMAYMEAELAERKP
jgi:hypothetical protein